MAKFLQRCLRQSWLFSTKVNLYYKSHKQYTTLLSSLVNIASLLVCLVVCVYYYSSFRTIYVRDMTGLTQPKQLDCSYCQINITIPDSSQLFCRSTNVSQGMCFQKLQGSNYRIVNCDTGDRTACHQLQLSASTTEYGHKPQITITYQTIVPKNEYEYISTESVKLPYGKGKRQVQVKMHPISIVNKYAKSTQTILQVLSIFDFSTASDDNSIDDSTTLIFSADVDDNGIEYAIEKAQPMEALLCFLGMYFMSMSVMSWLILQKFNQCMFIMDCSKLVHDYSIKNTRLVLFCLTFCNWTQGYWAAKDPNLMECYHRGTRLLQLQTFLEQLARLSWQDRPNRRNRRCRTGPSFDKLDEEDKQLVQALASDDISKQKIYSIYDPSMFMEASGNTYR